MSSSFYQRYIDDGYDVVVFHGKVVAVSESAVCESINEGMVFENVSTSLNVLDLEEING